MSSTDYSFYPFKPVLALPWVFAGIIIVLGLFNVWQNLIKWRWRHFGFIMSWASAIWTAGFICRGISQTHPTNLGLFIAQYVLTFVGPPLFGASETFILGRLMAYLPYAAPMHPGRVISTFLLLSAVVESIGASGSSYVASAAKGSNESLLREGLHLMEASLVLQCCVELLFLALAARTHWNAVRIIKIPRHVKTILGILYLTSTMLLVRCIFRVVQAFQEQACIETGNCGASITNQAYFWVFEVANITLFVIILTIIPPGSQLPSNNAVYLDQTNERTERLGPGFSNADKRPLVVTILDPFNLGGLITGKGMAVTAFWLEDHPIYEGDKRHLSKITRAPDEVEGTRAATKEESTI